MSVPEGCQTLFLVSHSARKNQKQSLTPRTHLGQERISQTTYLAETKVRGSASSYVSGDSAPALDVSWWKLPYALDAIAKVCLAQSLRVLRP